MLIKNSLKFVEIEEIINFKKMIKCNELICITASLIQFFPAGGFETYG